MKIKHLLAQLRTAPRDAFVRFDFCGCVALPIVESWRGDYSQASVRWSDDYAEGATVEALVAALDKALRETHFGYKGGTYTFSPDTEIWVDNHGRCTNTEITMVAVDDFEVVLHTRRRDG